MQPNKKYVKKGIIKHIKKEEIPTEPDVLPAGFEWDTFDIMNDEVATEIANFLNANYVSDPNGYFVE
jgi:hypothetical protein